MTAKEQLRVILKRGAYWTTLEDQDNALTLLDQIDDRAGKMEEFIKRRRQYARDRASQHGGDCEWQRGFAVACATMLEYLETKESPTLTAAEWWDYE